MAQQSKGFCKYCGKEYTKGGMLRHLAACKERKSIWDMETGKRKCGYFEIVLYDKYQSDYWLIIEMRDTATLRDLDQFIRAIWVECCGHLSAFDIEGVDYESVPNEDDFWGEPSKSMNYKLKDVFEVGMLAGYEYDYGSTTELIIKIQDHRTGVLKKDVVTILSRNNPPEIICSVCGKKKAKWIIPERYFEEDAFRCEDCLRDHDEEDEWDEDEYADDGCEYCLPVCNSPRMGICDYEGSSSFPDVFEPDKKA